MELVTLEEIKQQLYLDDTDTSEDDYLLMLASASIAHIQNYTNRKIFQTKESVPDGVDNSLVWSDDIKIACMLLIGHLYANRENSADKAIHSIPFGFHAFVSPYKYIPI